MLTGYNLLLQAQMLDVIDSFIMHTGEPMDDADRERLKTATISRLQGLRPPDDGPRGDSVDCEVE